MLCQQQKPKRKEIFQFENF
jgi:hypothetical protein